MFIGVGMGIMNFMAAGDSIQTDQKLMTACAKIPTCDPVTATIEMRHPLVRIQQAAACGV
jgi:hypothetical protein